MSFLYFWQNYDNRFKIAFLRRIYFIDVYVCIIYKTSEAFNKTYQKCDTEDNIDKRDILNCLYKASWFTDNSI